MVIEQDKFCLVLEIDYTDRSRIRDAARPSLPSNLSFYHMLKQRRYGVAVGDNYDISSCLLLDAVDCSHYSLLSLFVRFVEFFRCRENAMPTFLSYKFWFELRLGQVLNCLHA